MSGPMVELEMQLHIETEKAILVSEDGEEESAVWLPKSQIVLTATIPPARLSPSLVRNGWLIRMG